MKISKIAAILVFACFSAPALADLGDELRGLLEKGKSAEAYALLNDHPERLGEPIVDFYFGVAATDSGHAAEGVLALERYVLNFPENRAARLELARANFVVGDDQRAREEFVKALSGAQNDAETATIERFLDAIRTRESRYQPSFSAFAEIGTGFDSNVNGGVSNSSISLPVLGQVSVLAGGLKQADSFTSLALGAQGSYPLAPGAFLIGGLNTNGKIHQTESVVDQLSMGGWGGVSFLNQKNTYSLLASYEQLSIENDRYRKTTAVLGNLTRQLNELQSVSLGVQLGEITYEGNNSLRDADLQGLVLGWRGALIHPLQPVLSLQASWAKELNQARRQDLGKETLGARAALAITPAARWGLSAGVSWNVSEYAADDPILSTTRKDNFLAADFTASYRVDRNWSVRGSALIAKNNSNIELYDYSRNVAEIKLRYDF